MKLNSEYFDCIRKPPKRPGTRESAAKTCSWRGCHEKGGYPAPVKPGSNKHYYFCLEHVKKYNKNFNYFNSLEGDSVDAHQREALTGERPTWKLGARHARNRAGPRIIDPWHLLDPDSRTGAKKTSSPFPRKPKTASRKSLEKLGLPDDASPEDIKAKFKALAKTHHPDLNGGDRSGEQELKEYIKAYNTLKSNGFC